MTTAEITGRDWDDLQAEIRTYAQTHDIDVSPEGHITLNDARVSGISLYTKRGMIAFATIYPFFNSDGKTLKSIKIDFETRYGAEEMLRSLGIEV